MEELGEIKSYNFNNKLLLAIDSKWTDYFNSENPTFKAIIQNGKLVLVGPNVNRSGPTSSHMSNGADSIE